MRIANAEYAAVCGLQKKNMRQSADRVKTSMRQYAEYKKKVCGSMWIAKEEYAAICDSSSDAYSSSCGSRCISLVKLINAVRGWNRTDKEVLCNTMKIAKHSLW